MATTGKGVESLTGFNLNKVSQKDKPGPYHPFTENFNSPSESFLPPKNLIKLIEVNDSTFTNLFKNAKNGKLPKNVKLSMAESLIKTGNSPFYADAWRNLKYLDRKDQYFQKFAGDSLDTSTYSDVLTSEGFADDQPQFKELVDSHLRKTLELTEDQILALKGFYCQTNAKHTLIFPGATFFANLLFARGEISFSNNGANASIKKIDDTTFIIQELTSILEFNGAIFGKFTPSNTPTKPSSMPAPFLIETQIKVEVKNKTINSSILKLDVYLDENAPKMKVLQILSVLYNFETTVLINDIAVNINEILVVKIEEELSKKNNADDLKKYFESLPNMLKPAALFYLNPFATTDTEEIRLAKAIEFRSMLDWPSISATKVNVSREGKILRAEFDFEKVSQESVMSLFNFLCNQPITDGLIIKNYSPILFFPKEIIRLLKNKRGLTSLEFINCGIFDLLIKPIEEHCPSLKKLSFINTELSHTIISLKQVEEVILSENRSLHTAIFEAPMLKKLTIRGCAKLSKVKFEEIIDLEKLALDQTSVLTNDSVLNLLRANRLSPQRGSSVSLISIFSKATENLLFPNMILKHVSNMFSLVQGSELKLEGEIPSNGLFYIFKSLQLSDNFHKIGTITLVNVTMSDVDWSYFATILAKSFNLLTLKILSTKVSSATLCVLTKKITDHQSSKLHIILEKNDFSIIDIFSIISAKNSINYVVSFSYEDVKNYLVGIHNFIKNNYFTNVQILNTPLDSSSDSAQMIAKLMKDCDTYCRKEASEILKIERSNGNPALTTSTLAVIDCDGNTILHKAVMDPKVPPEDIRYLIEKFFSIAGIVTQTNHHNQTAYALAQDLGHIDICAIFDDYLPYPRIDVLHRALQEKNINIGFVDYLMGAGLDLATQAGVTKNNALHWIVKVISPTNDRVLSMFFQDPNRDKRLHVALNQKNSDGQTPYDCAVAIKNSSAIEIINKFLHNRNALEQAVNPETSSTPFLVVDFIPNLELFYHAIQDYTNNPRSNYKYISNTIKFMLSQKQYEPVVAPLDKKSSDTALHLTIRSGNIKVFTALINSLPDETIEILVKLQNLKGETIFDLLEVKSATSESLRQILLQRLPESKRPQTPTFWAPSLNFSKESQDTDVRFFSGPFFKEDTMDNQFVTLFKLTSRGILKLGDKLEHKTQAALINSKQEIESDMCLNTSNYDKSIIDPTRSDDQFVNDTFRSLIAINEESLSFINANNEENLANEKIAIFKSDFRNRLTKYLSEFDPLIKSFMYNFCHQHSGPRGIYGLNHAIILRLLQQQCQVFKSSDKLEFRLKGTDPLNLSLFEEYKIYKVSVSEDKNLTVNYNCSEKPIFIISVEYEISLSQSTQEISVNLVNSKLSFNKEIDRKLLNHLVLKLSLNLNTPREKFEEVSLFDFEQQFTERFYMSLKSAILSGKISQIKYFISAGLDLTKELDDEGNTALHCALLAPNKAEVFQLIFESINSDKKEAMLLQKNKQNHSIRDFIHLENNDQESLSNSKKDITRISQYLSEKHSQIYSKILQQGSLENPRHSRNFSKL